MLATAVTPLPPPSQDMREALDKATDVHLDHLEFEVESLDVEKARRLRSVTRYVGGKNILRRESWKPLLWACDARERLPWCDRERRRRQEDADLHVSHMRCGVAAPFWVVAFLFSSSITKRHASVNHGKPAVLIGETGSPSSSRR